MPSRTEAGLPALRLIPEYHERVWGGRRLAPDAGGRAAPVGEAWIVHEHNRDRRGADIHHSTLPSGIKISTVVPWPSRLDSRNVPPSSCTRSRIEDRPRKVVEFGWGVMEQLA